MMLPPQVTEQRKPPTGSTRCNVCRLPYAAHSGVTCRLCNRPAEHHRDGEVEAELLEAARLAAARRHAGLELTDVAAWALARHPQPTTTEEDPQP
jgi:hypothetical protein